MDVLRGILSCGSEHLCFCARQAAADDKEDELWKDLKLSKDKKPPIPRTILVDDCNCDDDANTDKERKGTVPVKDASSTVDDSESLLGICYVDDDSKLSSLVSFANDLRLKVAGDASYSKASVQSTTADEASLWNYSKASLEEPVYFSDDEDSDNITSCLSGINYNFTDGGSSYTSWGHRNNYRTLLELNANILESTKKRLQYTTMYNDNNIPTTKRLPQKMPSSSTLVTVSTSNDSNEI